MTERGPSGYQTSHQHLCAVLREILIEAVQAGRRAAGGLDTVAGRAVAALYLILLQHPIDRHGRCRSCRRPGAVLGGRWRRCRVHGEARVWLYQPVDFLRSQLACELDLDGRTPPATDPPPHRLSQPDTDTLPSIRTGPHDLFHHTAPAAPPPRPDRGDPRAGRPDPGHGGAGDHPDGPRPRRDPPGTPPPGRHSAPLELLGGVVS